MFSFAARARFAEARSAEFPVTTRRAKFWKLLEKHGRRDLILNSRHGNATKKHEQKDPSRGGWGASIDLRANSEPDAREAGSGQAVHDRAIHGDDAGRRRVVFA